jgi:hypothetical protein
MTVHSLGSEEANYAQTGGDPKYFGKPFKVQNSLTVRNKGAIYSYVREPGDNEDIVIWVDFANMKLGGGVFGDGFVQEEVMCLEMPDLANAAATGMTTRGPGAGVLAGDPKPLLFEGVHRVMSVEGVYGEKWADASYDQLKKDDHDLKAAQKLDVLAMAAPDLAHSKKKYNDPDTIKDLFNTFEAGFRLAKKEAGGKTVLVNTGRIGTGAFDNSPAVVYVLQCLAAQDVGGIDLRFWGYDDATVKELNSKYYRPILDRYKGAQPQTIKHLLEIATDQLATAPPHGAPHGAKPATGGGPKHNPQ